MVENKHSINTILSFGAKSVNPEILEQLLTGRNNTADFLENKVKSVVENGDNQFILVIGQRGMGKTHLLKVLHSRIWHYSQENKLKISYFAEEEYGVANFFDFLLRILNSFIKWYDQDTESLKNELEKLQETSSANQLNYLEKIIKEYTDNKPLLIITENFGDILDQMGQEEQGRLRAWLYENNNVSIVASSQSVSDNFDREDRPFYGFFTPYYLKSLSFEESFDFLISLAKIEKNDKLVKHLQTKGKPQVRAVFDLVKGNHRLLVTFYHFLKTDMLAKVSEVFIKTINDLKPYYETYIRYLPAQQQKILRYIALSRKPQLGVEISKNCFIEQKSLSKQLSELNKKRLVDIIPDPSDKRNKFYDISEPLLRISIEVGEHKEGITALFIDFLAYYYNSGELVNRKSKFLSLLDYCDTEKEKQEVNYEIKAINKAIEIKRQIISENFLTFLREEKYDEASDFIINEKIGKLDLNIINIIIADYAYKLRDYKKSSEFYDKININLLDNYTNIIGSKTKFLSNYSEAIIRTGIEAENMVMVEKGIHILNRIDKNDNTNKKYTILISIAKLAIIIHNLDKSINVETIDEELISIYNLSDKAEKTNDKNEVEIQEILLTFYAFIIEVLLSKNSKKSISLQNSFVSRIKCLQEEKRLDIFKHFQENSFYHIFKLLLPIIQQDLKKRNKELENIIVNWTNNILKNNDEFKTDDIFFMQNFIKTHEKNINELKIVNIYYETYKEVILNKNESALYELPKEQREFFEKNILNKKI